MQKSKSFKRLLAIVLTVAMMLTAIPFVTAADEAKETVNFGTYNGAPIKWDVLKTLDNGDLVLISSDVVLSSKYLEKSAVPNYANSAIHATLNGSFYEDSFSAAEKALIKDSTVEYITKTTTATITAKVIIPNTAMVTTYTLGAVSDKYWLADGQGTAGGKAAKVVATSGSITNNGVTNAAGVRPMITIAAVTSGKFEAADGVTFTVADAAVETYTSIADVAFKVVIDTEKYTANELVVKLGDTVLTAVDGVYTIPAKSTDTVTVSGIVALPADFTAYNAAKASAEKVDRDLYTVETLEALDAALATDVSACTKLNQANVDAAAQAILDAIANLKYKPADTAAYLKAVEETRKILKNEPVEITPTLTASIYNLNAFVNEMGDDFLNAMTDALNAYEDGRGITPISTYTIDKQAEVDAATAVLEDLNARVPLMRADTSAWSATLGNIRNLSPTRYANAGKLIAEANAIAAETDYAKLNPDILQQADVDAATAKLKEIYAKAEIILSDFSSLDAVLAIANTYVKENYYTEEEMAGAGDAWNNFEKARDAAKALNREDNAIFADHQGNINSAVSDLINAMGKLPAFERLTDEEVEFINPTKDFFTEIMNFFGMISGLLVALAGLLPLLFFPPEEGGLVLYDVFAMIGDEDLLAFVEKLGIKPAPDPENPDPENPETPAEPAK